MTQKDMVQGLSVSELHAFDRVCKACSLSKSHQLPFPKDSATKHEKMDLIVIDLTGPMSVETWSGMSYALMVFEVSC